MRKELREKVFDKYEGHCAYSGCELKMDDMQVDHIVDLVKNNMNVIKKFKNKRPQGQLISA